MRWAAFLCLVGAAPASAAVLRVGAGAEHPTLAAALHAAKDGDTVHVGAGSYFECAVISQSRLVLEGEGDATVLTDRPCEGKALLVVRGNDLTVRDMVLARVRVPDRNGAGVRLEGRGLTLDRVRFDNDEVGVLSGQAEAGDILIRGCTFTSGGVAGERPTAAVMVGGSALLRIERSSFENVKGGQVASSARLTELVGNTFTLGEERGSAVPITGSGRLQMTDNLIEVAAPLPGHGAAVLATGPGASLQGNTLRNRSGTPATLLLDWTSSTPVTASNTLGPNDTEVSGSGLLRHRAGTLARDVAGELRGAAGAAKRAVKGMLGR